MSNIAMIRRNPPAHDYGYLGGEGRYVRVLTRAGDQALIEDRGYRWIPSHQVGHTDDELRWLNDRRAQLAQAKEAAHA